MTHYVCRGGCKGVAQVPGTCQTATCLSHGKPLEPCNCTDDLHDLQLVEEDSTENEESNQATK